MVSLRLPLSLSEIAIARIAVSLSLSLSVSAVSVTPWGANGAIGELEKCTQSWLSRISFLTPQVSEVPMPEPSPIPTERIERAILILRGHKVMLDSELATLYSVGTKALNQAVNRNIERFPEDFMFRLTEEEATRLRSQIVTLKTGRGRHRKYLP